METVKVDAGKIIEAQKLLTKVEHDISEVEMLTSRIASVWSVTLWSFIM